MQNKLIPSVAIRVDSGYEIGSGHVRRCLSMAALLRSNGFQVIFICRNIAGSINHVIEQSGFKLVLLPKDDRFVFSVFSTIFSEAEFENMVYDADDSADALIAQYPKSRIAWVITDHMLIRKAWQLRFSVRLNCKVLAISGQANAAHHADILLDPQLHENPAEKWTGQLTHSCEIFSGPFYLPLPESFELAREKAVLRLGPPKRILVCFGGTDIHNIVYRTADVLLTQLNRFPNTKFEIDIAVPDNHISLENLYNLVDSENRFHVHVGLNDLSALISKADLAIGGGGIMLWERCLLGLPSIVLPLAENQEKPIKKLEERGAVMSVKQLDVDFEREIEKALRHFFKSSEALYNMSSSAFEVMKEWPRTKDWLDIMQGFKNV